MATIIGMLLLFIGWGYFKKQKNREIAQDVSPWSGGDNPLSAKEVTPMVSVSQEPATLTARLHTAAAGLEVDPRQHSQVEELPGTTPRIV
jgi:hypothetical protein